MADAKVQAEVIETGSLPGGGIWESWRVFNNELVNATGVVDSVVNTQNSVLGFVLAEFRFFGLWFNAQSASGTADVKVEILESYNDTSTNYALPNTGATVVASHGETAKVYALAPSPMKRLRIRVTGVASNPADTRVDAVLWMQT